MPVYYVKIILENGSQVWGKIIDNQFVTPSGAKYKVDNDGFVIYRDGKKYRTVPMSYRNGDKNDALD